MFKNIFKETTIVLLIILIILLAMGIILYQYIPTGKIVPVIQAYEIPDNIKNEINENVEDNDKETIITYKIDEEDLINYERGNDYQKGKINPFSKTASQPTSVETGSSVETSNNETTKTQNTTQKNETANEESQNTGLK